MAVVYFSSAQRSLVGGAESVELEATRVVDLIRALVARFPELADRLDDLAVSIDGEIYNDGRYRPLEADSEVHFVGAVAGGCASQRAEP